MTVYAQTLSKLSVSPWIRFPFKYRNEFSRANDNLKKEWQILKVVQREGGSLPKKYKKNTFPTHKTAFFEVKPPIFRTKKKNFLFFLIYFRSPKKKKRNSSREKERKKKRRKKKRKLIVCRSGSNLCREYFVSEHGCICICMYFLLLLLLLLLL
ncbi:hypothetical protein CMESO_210 (nucleomorph) [Chroomonas mesostigmatica CCMP1168]|uniref:Uncharacterized protein n=1 Tax=Chroomonas mesostigmatica CCMP1168 TaxID=1195612 RepID=J7G2X7_9CRYP|nr:hypothetical protein CMESO_210 [Chroomonas mesostigmatica CCMP1168]